MWQSMCWWGYWRAAICKQIVQVTANTQAIMELQLAASLRNVNLTSNRPWPGRRLAVVLRHDRSIWLRSQKIERGTEMSAHKISVHLDSGRPEHCRAQSCVAAGRRLDVAGEWAQVQTVNVYVRVHLVGLHLYNQALFYLNYVIQ